MRNVHNCHGWEQGAADLTPYSWGLVPAACPSCVSRYKFDMRVYVLVTTVSPHLTIFMFKNGLVRLCTERYKRPRDSNLENAYMHLTNYAINKNRCCTLPSYLWPFLSTVGGGGGGGGKSL